MSGRDLVPSDCRSQLPEASRSTLQALEADVQRIELMEAPTREELQAIHTSLDDVELSARLRAGGSNSVVSTVDGSLRFLGLGLTLGGAGALLYAPSERSESQLQDATTGLLVGIAILAGAVVTRIGALHRRTRSELMADAVERYRARLPKPTEGVTGGDH